MPVSTEAVSSISQSEIRFRRILFATDFSDASNRALNYALALAQRHKAELLTVHAVEPEPREAVPLDPLPRELDAAWMKAEEAMQRLRGSAPFNGLSHREIVRRGEVLDVLNQIIRREKCDLLLTGTHGRRGLAKLALGSIAEQILHLTVCPVLTVGPFVHAVPQIAVDITRILFATDFGAASRKAFSFAVGLAKSYQAKLTLLHLIEPMPVAEITPAAYGPPSYAAEEFGKWQEARKHESEARLKNLADSVEGLPFAPVIEVGTDLIPEGILETARSSDTDLIVMGVNHADSPRLASHFPWVLTSEVIRKAKCPVLTWCV